MPRPTISRSIKRNRLREMGADCAEAGQEFVSASELHPATEGGTDTKPKRKGSRPKKTAPRSRKQKRAA